MGVLIQCGPRQNAAMYRCCLGVSLLRNGDFGRGIWSIRCIGGGGIFCRSFFRRGGCSWGRQCSAEIIRQNVLGAADVHGKQIRCNLGHPAQPGGGAGWAAGQGTVRVTLAHAQGGVVPGNQKVIQQKLGFGVKIFRCGIGIHQQGGRLCPLAKAP